MLYLSQATQTGGRAGGRRAGAGRAPWGAPAALQGTARAQPGQARLSAGSGRTQGPSAPCSALGSPEAGAGSDSDHRCRCHCDFGIRWSRARAACPGCLSRKGFGRRLWLQVSEQSLSITASPPSGDGRRRLGSGCLQRASRLQSSLQSLPIANLTAEEASHPSLLPDSPVAGHPPKALPAMPRSPEPVLSPKASPLSPSITEPALRAKLENLVH